MKKLLGTLVFASSAMFTAMSAHAAPVAAAEWSGGQTQGSFDGPWTVGYSFTLTSSVRVTDLGVYDHNGDGLGRTSTVGLWTSTGTLLTSTTVASGTAAPLIGHFRYADITDIVIGVGNYVVAASDLGGDLSMAYSYSPIGFTTSALLTNIGSAFANGSGLRFPANVTVGDDRIGYFGGNLLIDSATSTVPDPSTLALVGLALAGLAASARRRPQ